MKNRNDNYLITPQQKIKMGEILLSKSGDPSLRVKKPNSNTYEIIPLLTLQKMIITKIRGTA